MFAYSTSCHARADKPPAEPPIIEIRAGQIAPFDGDLIPPLRAARMAAKIELAKERLIAEVNRVVLIHEIELKRWKDKEAIRAKFDDERRRLLEVEIERLDVWYRSPVFVGSVAFGVAIVVIFAASAFSGALQGTL